MCDCMLDLRCWCERKFGTLERIGSKTLREEEEHDAEKMGRRTSRVEKKTKW